MAGAPGPSRSGLKGSACDGVSAALAPCACAARPRPMDLPRRRRDLMGNRNLNQDRAACRSRNRRGDFRLGPGGRRQGRRRAIRRGQGWLRCLGGVRVPVLSLGWRGTAMRRAESPSGLRHRVSVSSDARRYSVRFRLLSLGVTTALLVSWGRHLQPAGPYCGGAPWTRPPWVAALPAPGASASWPPDPGERPDPWSCSASRSSGTRPWPTTASRA